MNDPQNRLSKFSTGAGGTRRRRADNDKCLISVHALTEFEYCPRAGLVAHESDPEDTGQEIFGPVLDYSPLYELREINRQLNLLGRRVWPWLLVLVVVLIATVVSMLLFSRLFAISGVIAVLIVSIPLIRLMCRIIVLYDRKKVAENTPDREPDANSLKDETIGWWEILQADFHTSSYTEALIDAKMGLTGKPQKVLRRGELVIPVFFSRGGPLQRQHYVRIAGYCHLIEYCEQVQSPYGLVVEKGTYEAHVLKNTRYAQDVLHQALRDARKVIREEAPTGVPPAVTDASGKCKKCPIGDPQLYRKRETELVCNEIPIPVHRLRAPNGGPIYHSHCGDRFRWRPPHRKVSELDLFEAR